MITSRQLLCVQFASDLNENKVASGLRSLVNPLVFLAKEALGSYAASTHPWTAIGFSNVAYPSQALTQTEKDSRTVSVCELNNLASVRLVSSWYKDALINGLIFKFEGEDEFTITFYAPKQAEKTHKLLTEQLEQST